MRQLLSYEKIAELLYRFILEQITEPERRLLQKWARKSVYNMGLINDLQTDPFLRDRLITSYFNDPSQFWKIVVSHRAALHSFMPERLGNFWQRLIRFKKI